MSRHDKAAPPPGSPLDVEALLSGDEAAFELLVRQESPRLFRVINRVVNDEDEAASLMQETFLQAYQRLHTFRRESKFTTWLYAIGINLARASLRKTRRLSPLDEDAVERMQPEFNGGMYRDPVETWNPQRLAELSQRRELVHQAIAQLPDDYRTVITLRDIEEIKTEEVARILDISNGAVRVRLHRARQALRKLLDRHLRDQ
ncbi:MAG: sigma-70 family RNA polymerase sigma factor [Rhodothermales bacterium]|nr:sigma-70 family RNA polymerase sigma factor [Rhodothermales bacterium]MBO6780148.1 sigma-70 family RNA polymerase sigma factor [Rhodothermales bacterium]